MSAPEQASDRLFFQLAQLYALLAYVEAPAGVVLSGAGKERRKSAGSQDGGAEVPPESEFDMLEGEDVEHVPSVPNQRPPRSRRRTRSSAEKTAAARRAYAAEIGRRSSLVQEYSVIFHERALGLHLEPSGPDGPLMVRSFAKASDGAVMPAEQCGEIAVGDELAGVNRTRLSSTAFADVRKLIAASERPITLHFRRRVDQ